MKVLFVCSGNSYFGIAPFIKSQGESLRNNGINIDYFPIKGKGFMGYFKNILKLKKYLQSNKYDLIHVHYCLSGWVAKLASPATPLIISFMGSDIYGGINKKGKIKLSGYLTILSSFLLQFFVKKVIIKSKRLEKPIYLKRKINIIPNGVDLKKFYPMNKLKCRKYLRLPFHDKIILFLGNPNNPIKNFELLKKAFNLLNGEGLKLIYPYPVKPDSVVKYLNAADVLVLTSFHEGSPNVIKEAMACNCPIVSTDVGDVKEVIGHTPGCYLTSFDAADCAEKIKLALDFRKKTDGRKKVRHLEINKIAKKIINLYGECLGGKVR
jgi:glycosyltransferase involved in cell wall biosynthesis